MEQMTANGWFWLGVVALALAGLVWFAAWHKPSIHTLAQRARKDPTTGVCPPLADTGRGSKKDAA